MSNHTNTNTNGNERDNSELHNLPGFFFYPPDSTRLIALTFNERMLLLRNQGNYIVNPHLTPASEREHIDFNCLLDNSRIPTHCEMGATIPEYGKVPVDFTDNLKVSTFMPG